MDARSCRACAAKPRRMGVVNEHMAAASSHALALPKMEVQGRSFFDGGICRLGAML